MRTDQNNSKDLNSIDPVRVQNLLQEIKDELARLEENIRRFFDEEDEQSFH